MKRFLAAASLLILGITETAPHRHADSLEVWFDDSLPQQNEHVVRCDGPTSGVAHVHRNQSKQVDPCVACFRQHMQATRSKIILGSPYVLQQFLIVTARVMHARSIRLRKSSRGPPILAS